MSTLELWLASWRALEADPPDADLFLRLCERYSEGHRAYHTLNHIRECFQQLAGYPLEPDQRGELEIALWFHDAIYDTQRHDNENLSAAWAADSLERAAVPQQVIANVRDLILITKCHSTPATPDQALMIDIDLSILGAAPDRFYEYERQIRHEYSWLPEDAYRDARSRVLREFQDRHLLYTTEHFRKTLEVRARENLARSLRSLRA
jgi:predicted metal-dependent HD superfamily phosphohydrolase